MGTIQIQLHTGNKFVIMGGCTDSVLQTVDRTTQNHLVSVILTWTVKCLPTLFIIRQVGYFFLLRIFPGCPLYYFCAYSNLCSIILKEITDGESKTIKLFISSLYLLPTVIFYIIFAWCGILAYGILILFLDRHLYIYYIHNIT